MAIECKLPAWQDQTASDADRQALIARYAAGDVTWAELRARGFEDYVQVLGALGEAGLRPPMAPMRGPSVAARECGRAIIREALLAKT